MWTSSELLTLSTVVFISISHRCLLYNHRIPMSVLHRLYSFTQCRVGWLVLHPGFTSCHSVSVLYKLSSFTLSVSYLPQKVTAVDQTCSVVAAESTSASMDSISLRLSTPGQHCAFSVSSVDSISETIDCVLSVEQNDGATFDCLVGNLEPGTSYALEVASKTDAERANVTLHTSKSRLWGRVDRVRYCGMRML